MRAAVEATPSASRLPKQSPSAPGQRKGRGPPGGPAHRRSAAREAAPDVVPRPAGQVGGTAGGHRDSATGDREAVRDDLQGARLCGPDDRGKRNRLFAGTRAGAGRPGSASQPARRRSGSSGWSAEPSVQQRAAPNSPAAATGGKARSAARRASWRARSSHRTPEGRPHICIKTRAKAHRLRRIVRLGLAGRPASRSTKRDRGDRAMRERRTTTAPKTGKQTQRPRPQ